MNQACPASEVLERLLADELSQAEEGSLEAHVAGCDACQRRLEELTRSPQPLEALPGGDKDAPPERGVLARLAGAAASPLRPVVQAPEEKPSSRSAARWYSASSSMQASRQFLRRQFWTWPLIAALVLGIAGWWVNRSVESAMRQQRVHELTTVLEADVSALRNWMESERTAAVLVAADDDLEPMVSELLALADGTPDAPSRLIRSPAQGALRMRLAERLRTAGFTGFTLVSPSGLLIAADGDAPVGATVSGYRREFFARVSGGEAAVSKPFLSPLLLPDAHGDLQANQPCMYAAVPIRGAEGRTVAALGLRIRPDDQFTRILQVARSGTSGETYAFDETGLLLSQSRFDDELRQIGLLVDRPGSRSILTIELRDPGANLVAGRRPAVRRPDQPLTRMAADAVQRRSGCDVIGYRDYRGVPVVGAWQWLDDCDFGVATEIDVKEAFAPASILRRAYAVLMGLLIAAAVGILLAMRLIARQQRQLHVAALAANQFGQYSLVERLGAGGMGTVYKARHALLRRPTAVKLLNPAMMSDTAIARFEREVQLTSGLTHPNTVAIYDYGRTEGGVFYYAMEHLEGVNLDDLVSAYGPLPEARAVHILRQVCASLAEAHAAGLVHRDVKPANIVLTFRGGLHDFVKVLDFGLAKPVRESGDSNLTLTETFAGTPLYASPEAITHSDRIDARADVYAIGAVSYFLLTGTPVFTGESAADTCLMHLTETPQPPSARRGSPVTPVLESIVLRCLSKAPVDRPDDAAELQHLFDACLVGGTWSQSDAARWWQEHDGRGDVRV